MLINVTLHGGPGDGERVTIDTIVGTFIYWANGIPTQYKQITNGDAILPYYVYSQMAGYKRWQQQSV